MQIVEAVECQFAFPIEVIGCKISELAQGGFVQNFDSAVASCAKAPALAQHLEATISVDGRNSARLRKVSLQQLNRKIAPVVLVDEP